MSDKTMGQVAFEAYRAQVKTAFNGDPIPEWDALDNGAPARRGWEAAARAVLAFDAEQHKHPGPVRDFREERATRWTPVGNPPTPAEVESLPPGATMAPLPPEAYQGQHSVPVDVELDVECDHPGCSIDHDRN